MSLNKNPDQSDLESNINSIVPVLGAIQNLTRRIPGTLVYTVGSIILYVPQAYHRAAESRA